jgi:hypothetical protein
MELTATFGQQAVGRWEDEVASAESLRLGDVKVMDMYSTEGQALAAALALAVALALAAAATSVQSAVEEWIVFTITFEQMQ